MQTSLDAPNRPHVRGRLSGAGPGPGPDRRLPSRLSRTVSPYASVPQQMVFHGGSKVPEPTKLYISNIDYGVTNDDIKILFSEVGDLKLHSIHYDKSGRSKGTAEVVYEQHCHAIQAMKRYNDCLLDGKPLKIELVGVQVTDPPNPFLNGDGILGKPNIPLRSVYGHGKKRGDWVSYGNSATSVGIGIGIGIGHGRARGPGQRMNHDKKKLLTAEELDAELERYHMEALQID